MVNYKSEEKYQNVLDGLERGRIKEEIQYQKRVENYNRNPKFCLNCDTLIEYSKRCNIFCSHNCAAKYNNVKRGIKTGILYCLNCEKSIEVKRYRSSKRKFCSGKCQQEYRGKIYIEKWLKGEISGGNPKDPQEVSSYIRNYMLKKANYMCMDCGWSKINPYSNTIPLELDHIDGHSENNRPENLRILCPGCHSLTPFYGTLNKGNGRRRFRELYRKENGN